MALNDTLNFFGLINILYADGSGSELDTACMYMDHSLSSCLITSHAQAMYGISDAIADEINDELRNEIHLLQDMRDALETAWIEGIEVTNSADFMSVFNWK